MFFSSLRKSASSAAQVLRCFWTLTLLQDLSLWLCIRQVGPVSFGCVQNADDGRVAGHISVGLKMWCFRLCSFDIISLPMVLTILHWTFSVIFQWCPLFFVEERTADGQQTSRGVLWWFFHLRYTFLSPQRLLFCLGQGAFPRIL